MAGAIALMSELINFTRKRLRFILGGLFYAIMFVYAGANAHQSLSARQSSTGWLMKERDGRVLVEQIAPGGPAEALLREQDEVVAIDGRSVKSFWQAYEISRLEPDTPYTLTIRRQGREQEVRLRTKELTPSTAILRILLMIVIPAMFLLVGFAVFALKPYDKQAMLLALMFGTFIPSESQFLTFAGYPPLLVAVMVAGGLISTFFAPLLFHFFLVFPERAPLLRRFPRLEWWLYVPNVVLTLPYFAAVNYVLIREPERVFTLARNLEAAGVATAILFVLYVVAGIATLLLKYRRASRLSRRKMRVAVAGSVVGFTPLMLLIGLGFFAERLHIAPGVLRWLSVAAIVAFLFFPLSFAYAIVRHQVIPIRFMLRRGIRYVFVSSGSKVLETVTAALALFFSLDSLFYYMRPSPLTIGVLSGVVSVVVWNVTSYLHHQHIAPVIDRHFFRRAYNAQQILSELGQGLRVMADMREMTSLVSTKMQDALQTENVSIFLRDEVTGEYPCAISSHHISDERLTVTTGQTLALPRGAFVLERLRESAQPLTVDFQDPQSWTRALLTDNSATQTRRRESEVLQSINSALLLPVATKEQLLGVISLGPRLGDLPFSREDRQMLMAVAWQMAMAMENAQLVRRKVEEERLRRELEMATEVQRRLFPECPPKSDGLELAGLCHPARGVGGDYYDFLVLDAGKVGIAVADVAGKGISAALLMSTVQASLRSQAYAVRDCLTDLVSSMNRLLCKSTSAANYASFFYAQYDERERLLTYVNAGHNPPILLRAANLERPKPLAVAAAGDGGGMQTVGLGDGLRMVEGDASTSGDDIKDCTQLLTTGGPVIGLFDEFTYEQETLEMQSGDLLVAYTDGLTEALNPQGEEFGQERLQALVASNAALHAEELARRITDSVHEWCRDTPQHDDLTLVVMKVK